jgi:hypothetical protein
MNIRSFILYNMVYFSATRALQSGLPSSPRKRREVIENIADSYGIEVISHIPSQTKVITEVEQQVKDFLYNDEVSRASPGMRDSVIVKNEMLVKEHRPMRHLLSSLKETYLMFKEESSSIKVGFSTFAKMRRKCCPEVLLTADLPHSCCMCIVHENFIK